MKAALRGGILGFADRLAVRFAVVLAAALLPLGVLSVIQTTNLQTEAVVRSEAALMGETLHAAETELRALRFAEGLSAGLAQTIPAYIGDSARCAAVLDAVQKRERIFSVVAYIPRDGKMTCSSDGRVFDFSESVLFHEMISKAEPGFLVNRKGPITGRSIVGIWHPVFAEDGRFAGVISLSLPHSELAISRNDAAIGATERAPVSLITFDSEGNILTSSSGMEDAPNRLPAGRTLKSMAGALPLSFSGLSVAGNYRSFSVVPLAEGKLYVLGTWPVDLSQSALGARVSPFVFPVLMWVASLLVAGLAAEGMVIRHIRALGRSITAFARGNRLVLDLDMSSSPLELRQLGAAYLTMTDNILRDEAELEDMVHQKEVLLREVHHRVKNNLQLIASIMNMQMRQAKSLEAKEVMKSVQDRVMSLATIHRELYQTSGVTDVRADELLRDIVRQVVNMGTGPGRRFEVTTAFDDLRLTPDQAVPMSLLLTEAMTNALKYAGAAEGALPTLHISLRRFGAGDAVLEVVNSIGENAPLAEGTGLGSQLLAAFTMQIGGTLEVGTVGDTYRLRTTFPIRSLAEAEARHGADEVD